MLGRQKMLLINLDGQNGQLLAFKEHCRLSQAILQFHVERMLHKRTPIVRFKSHRNAPGVFEDPFHWGDMTANSGKETKSTKTINDLNPGLTFWSNGRSAVLEAQIGTRFSQGTCCTPPPPKKKEFSHARWFRWCFLRLFPCFFLSTVLPLCSGILLLPDAFSLSSCLSPPPLSSPLSISISISPSIFTQFAEVLNSFCCS